MRRSPAAWCLRKTAPRRAGRRRRRGHRPRHPRAEGLCQVDPAWRRARLGARIESAQQFRQRLRPRHLPGSHDGGRALRHCRADHGRSAARGDHRAQSSVREEDRTAGADRPVRQWRRYRADRQGCGAGQGPRRGDGRLVAGYDRDRSDLEGSAERLGVAADQMEVIQLWEESAGLELRNAKPAGAMS